MNRSHGRAKRGGGGTAPSPVRSHVEAFEKGGYPGQFTPEPEGQIRHTGCGAVYDATAALVEEMRRADVSTDPGDQALVVALECGACHKKGTLVVSYGPAASRRDAEVLSRLQRRTRREQRR